MKKPRYSHKPKRLPQFERRVIALSLMAVGPGMVASLVAIAFLDWSLESRFTAALIIIVVTAIILAVLRDTVVRPLQTLANVIAAIREQDYSFRARGAITEDAMGELALEVNALADLLAMQKVRSVEAIALLGRVLEEVEAPIFAFDSLGMVRLVNTAGAKLVQRESSALLGRSALQVGLESCLLGDSEETFSFAGQQNPNSRWLIRRSKFREKGAPHTLVVLSDVSRALREEERSAWQRLIRVLGHELNNSLTPIKSIAGTLASRLASAPSGWDAREDFARGLAIVEGRAASLNRFLQAYRQLAQMPRPSLRRTRLRTLVERAAGLELRLQVQVAAGPEIDLAVDPDQMEQMLINLIRNAVDAALMLHSETDAEVRLTWKTHEGGLQISIEDNGPGLTNKENVFVPFYTTKPAGSGIGLVLSRQIAEAHRGSLDLLQREDQSGCVAVIELPRNL